MRVIAQARSSIPRHFVAVLALSIMGVTWVPCSAGPLGNAFIVNTGIPSPGRGAYLYRRGLPAGVRIPLPRPGVTTTAALSSSYPLVAYSVHRWGEPEIRDASAAREDVAVADTVGQTLATFVGGVRLAWSPHGDRLAVAIGCEWEVIPAFDSIVVWEPGRGVILSRRVPTSRGLMTWVGSDTVLVGASVMGPAHALSCRTGLLSATGHIGATVSPDGLYSVNQNMGGIGVGVYDDRTGSDFAYSLVTLLGIPKLGDVGPAYWVGTGKNDHTLALSVCPARGTLNGKTGTAECLTGFVDVATRRLLGWTEGRLVGMTADSREAVVSKRDSLEFIRRQDWLTTSLAPNPAPPSPRSEPRHPSSSGHRIAFAFTMQQIWCCDNGHLANALGYETGTVYALEAGGASRKLLSRPLGLWPVEAELNLRGDLVAAKAIASDSEAKPPSILVADTSGTLVAHFPEQSRFHWSPDGSHLALIGNGIQVWDRRKGVVARLALKPDDEAWTPTGELMIRIGKRVARLDWRSGDTTGTQHSAVDLSRDGKFSMDALPSSAGPRVFDDRMQSEITACSWGDVHSVAWGLSGDPFWSEEPHLVHDLWINQCDARLLGMAEGRLDGCELRLVDVDGMRQLASIPGKLIGRTADRQSVVVLRGTDFVIVPLDADGTLDRIGSKRRLQATRQTVRIRAVITQWGWKLTRSTPSRADTIGTHMIDVSEGAWLPDWSGEPMRCGRGMRVRSVNGKQVQIEYNAGEYTQGPAGPPGLATIAPGKEARLSTRTMDAGRFVQLMIAP